MPELMGDHPDVSPDYVTIGAMSEGLNGTFHPLCLAPPEAWRQVLTPEL